MAVLLRFQGADAWTKTRNLVDHISMSNRQNKLASLLKRCTELARIFFLYDVIIRVFCCWKTTGKTQSALYSPPYRSNHHVAERGVETVLFSLIRSLLRPSWFRTYNTSTRGHIRCMYWRVQYLDPERVRCILISAVSRPQICLMYVDVLNTSTPNMFDIYFDMFDTSTPTIFDVYYM